MIFYFKHGSCIARQYDESNAFNLSVFNTCLCNQLSGKFFVTNSIPATCTCRQHKKWQLQDLVQVQVTRFFFKEIMSNLFQDHLMKPSHADSLKHIARFNSSFLKPPLWDPPLILSISSLSVYAVCFFLKRA